ncbi:MAG TPA: hypothetical protein VLI69_02080 [Gammaproteobacteria bacterium]|nr:hypothetical protein [Gammaproteobacteria bacterium]
MNYSKKFFITGISVFLTTWLTSAEAIWNSTKVFPRNPTPKLSHTILLGQDYISMPITGAAGYGTRFFSTGLSPCPAHSTPQAIVLLAIPHQVPSAPSNPIMNYSVAIDTSYGTNGNGVVLNGSNVYEIYLKYALVQHSTTVSGGSAPDYSGIYTGGLVKWSIYCIPTP